MSEQCMSRPGEECRSATRLALLEKRVDGLEEGQSREESFRKAYYEEREARIHRETKLDAKIDAMDEKLDKVVEYQEAQRAKPAKRWEGIVDKAIWAVCAAVIAFLLARIGL